MVTEQHIAHLWLRMTRIYGHRWTSGFGDTDDGTWLTGLRSLSPDDLADGLRLCIHSGLEWPPSLPEFRRLALGITTAQIRLAAENMISDFDRHRMSHSELRAAISARMEQAARALTQQAIGDDDQKRLGSAA